MSIDEYGFEKRLFILLQIFAVDICAYADMHNHLHLLLRVDSEQVFDSASLHTLVQIVAIKLGKTIVP